MAIIKNSIITRNTKLNELVEKLGAKFGTRCRYRTAFGPNGTYNQECGSVPNSWGGVKLPDKLAMRIEALVASIEANSH